MSGKKVATKATKKVADKILHPPWIKTNIPAGGAVAAPPLGPHLGQRGVQIGPFCKQFNEMTANIKPGIPIPTYVRVNPNKTVDITTYKPPVSYFLKMAAGARKAGRDSTDVAGKVTVKHIYEIAKIKIEDPPNHGLTLKEVCDQIIAQTLSMNIKVVRDLDADEYATFLEDRKEKLAQYEEELEEKRQAKLLRL